MGKLVYTAIFLISFMVTFVSTFPAKTVVGYYLTENKVNYSKIEGNIFNLSIYDVEIDKIYIPKLDIENNLISIVAKLNMENFFKVNFLEKKAKLKLTELNLENFQKKPVVKGVITTSTKFIKNGDYILTKGQGKLLIKKLIPINIANIQVTWKVQPEEKKSKITANIVGKSISGSFYGTLIFPLSNRSDVRIKGVFSGKIFGRNVKQEININPFLLKGI